ncbi:DUF454 family protein [Ochrobactrum quorumnocens]|uniref:DUF454 family protein n=1 Tax=Ochrobactrum quorumnocens TaxID=271865 RepID=A0A5N1JWZ6_9HYPH|nr:DUF454 family protein [[Ochrobactrum] quorumnocens]KAA9368642.1 DUF454 family protein [[Ochrobactrum] quorumnocens]
MTASDINSVDGRTAPNSRSRAYPDERQRAGYLALGLLIAAALVGCQVRLMPSALFVFGALLCFVQLSPKALCWLETNGITRRVMAAWRRLNAWPRLYRIYLLAILAVVCLTMLTFVPQALCLEFAINGILCAGLLLFVGPQSRQLKHVSE